MEPPALRRAIEVAQAMTSELGLQVDDVVVIHNSDRVALRLVPSEALARVAPVGDLAASEFEVEVARRLAEVDDAPVAELDPRAEPRVHVRDGFAVSLWTYYEPLGSTIEPADYPDALHRYHAALRQVGDLDTPHFTDRVAVALKEVNDREQSPELADADRELLRETLSKLSAEISADKAGDQLLHGEPHEGNLLNTKRGPLFIDLVTCCRGPVEFDLAHAPEDVGKHYAGADERLIYRCRAVDWAMFSAWRWRRNDQMPDRDHWRAEGLKLVRAALARCEPG
ncbi:aminoglycoside phosphotransferase family protein [Streptomyces sp. NPDC088180]|uniref:aminoglycoside phosphotransferase family protein n=1 Tax=Streptomyces sp. NPDC088180 TaxID=3365837 RepID=UPI0037F26B49